MGNNRSKSKSYVQSTHKVFGGNRLSLKPNVDNKLKEPSIFAAIDANDSKRLRHLLKTGHNINKVDMNGLTALHCAALNGSEECIQVLIEFGCKLKLCALRLSSLHFAAQNANQNVINMLIDFGEAVNAKDVMGDTPLSAAVDSNNKQAAIALLKRGAILHTHVVMSAIEYGYSDILLELINYRPDIITSICLTQFRFTRVSVFGLKLLFFCGYKFSESFLNESQPLDWYDYCLTREHNVDGNGVNRQPITVFRVPPAHYNRDEDLRAFQSFCVWFKQQQSQPLSLKCMARIAFRSASAHSSVYGVLEKFENLPIILKEYLLLKDVLKQL